MNLLNHLRKSIMCVFQTISFLIQMHFLMHFYNSCEERDENTMLRYVHTNLIARDCQKLISFYKKVLVFMTYICARFCK